MEGIGMEVGQGIATMESEAGSAVFLGKTEPEPEFENGAQAAVAIIQAGRRHERAHVRATPDEGKGRHIAYEIGFSSGLHGESAEPPHWAETDPWDQEQFDLGHTYGAKVRAEAREAYRKVGRPKAIMERPDKPEHWTCHRPADARYRDGSTDHDETDSRVLMDLPRGRSYGIYFRRWEGCIGCGAIRAVDEFRNGTVKWRPWQWPKEAGS